MTALKTGQTCSRLSLRLCCTPPVSKEAYRCIENHRKGREKVNTEAFLDEYQPVMMSGRALNRLEACAVQQAPNSHPVSRSDQKRHDAAAQSGLMPPGKSKVMPARIDCFVRAEIVQILGNGCHLRSLSSHGLTCGRSDCEINSTARLTQICRLVGEKTQIQRVNLQLNAHADKLRAAEAKPFLFLKKSPADRCNYVHREEGTDRADTVALINDAQQHRRRRGRTRAGSKTSGSIKQMHEAVAHGQLKGAF